MQFPYFFTWSKQDSPVHFNLREVKDHQIILESGQRVFDLTSISWQASFGLKNQEIINPIIDQLRNVPMASPKAVYALKNEVTKKLLDLINVGPGKIFYTVSGAESVENALKMARQITGKSIILARQKSYHGASMGALAVTGDWRNENHLTLREHTVRIPEPDQDPDLEQTRKIIEKVGADKIAAFCLETVTGANGVYIPSAKWWNGIQKLGQEFNIKIILDEVICGFYRTGRPFGFFHFPIRPDFICLAKGISGGYVPFGAVYVSEECAKYYDQNVLSCGMTNYAHPLGLAALKGVLSFTGSSDFQNKLRNLIPHFGNLLGELRELPNVKTIRNIGMMAAIETTNKLNYDDFFNGGTYALVKDHMLLLAPSLTYGVDELTTAMRNVKKVLVQ